MRIVWATRPMNARIAIAAQILNNAGVLLLYIVNLVFAQRILRATHPLLGWSKALRIVFAVLYVLVLVALILVITLTVMIFYTLDPTVRSEGAWIQKGASIYLLLVAFLPLPILAVAFLKPRTHDIDHFGHGTLGQKALLLLFTSCLCTVIAGFKLGTALMPARPATDPAPYDSRACFYIFGFTFEILCLLAFLTFRVDQKFHVPDGSSKVRTYAVEQITTPGEGDPRATASGDSVEEKTSDYDRSDTDLA